jgi:uncharacterized protein YodC (DUF2158 family)
LALDEIKVGDVVQLNSGDAKMTVSSVAKSALEQLTAWCDWFEGMKAQSGAFPAPL